MKRGTFILIATLVASLIVFAACYLMVKNATRPVDDPQRSEAFSRHAAISERARKEFDKLHEEHLRNNCTPDILAEKLGLAYIPQRESRTDGGYEVRIELPNSYSRLIYIWAADGSTKVYAWEIVSPAANNVSWAEYRENLDICEAVFRYQFEHNASGAQQNAKVYFLEVFNKDPSPEFLARFKDNTPPVKKGSEFAIGEGLKFQVESIERVDKNTVRVSGGYYEAGLSASGNIYTVVRKKEKWNVEKDEMQWIA